MTSNRSLSPNEIRKLEWACFKENKPPISKTDNNPSSQIIDLTQEPTQTISPPQERLGNTQALPSLGLDNEQRRKIFIFCLTRTPSTKLKLFIEKLWDTQPYIRKYYHHPIHVSDKRHSPNWLLNVLTKLLHHHCLDILKNMCETNPYVQVLFQPDIIASTINSKIYTKNLLTFYKMIQETGDKHLINVLPKDTSFFVDCLLTENENQNLSSATATTLKSEAEKFINDLNSFWLLMTQPLPPTRLKEKERVGEKRKFSSLRM